MDPNWKGMKSLMDFYPKSESNAKTGRDAPTDLANESPQQPVGIKNLNGLDILLKEMQRSVSL
ncbi:hypothetical protein T01_5642 [Trichinella spiralis]|uniref:Uncharacterized protein n=1 Tax=Trichinella spiralis TaxID=6334 RepID=A0A0V1BG85_TRISP|nr:hypothetical protein T01_5642 [Trichinella spiralis]